MESLEIANRQIQYNKEITLTYKLKIIKSEYTSQINNKQYTNHKIRIPRELITILSDYDKLYFTIIDDTVHITTSENMGYVHKAKIQKHYYKSVTEYLLSLSKKVFPLVDEDQYLSWRILLENNCIKDSVACII